MKSKKTLHDFNTMLDVDLSSIRINKKLNKLSNKVLFPEKLEEANHTLTSIPLPKAWRVKK